MIVKYRFYVDIEVDADDGDALYTIKERADKKLDSMSYSELGCAVKYDDVASVMSIEERYGVKK
jgi:hypothetical protein